MALVLLMLSGIFTLLLFTVLGNLISDGLGVPIPGAVMGLVALVLYLQMKGGENESLDSVSQFCIRYLAVLFVPGCVGAFFLADLFAKQWLPVFLAVVIATPLTIGLTALVFQWILKRMGKAIHHG